MCQKWELDGRENQQVIDNTRIKQMVIRPEFVHFCNNGSLSLLIT
jgi:hypothetical protein